MLRALSLGYGPGWQQPGLCPYLRVIPVTATWTEAERHIKPHSGRAAR